MFVTTQYFYTFLVLNLESKALLGLDLDDSVLVLSSLQLNPKPKPEASRGLLVGFRHQWGRMRPQAPNNSKPQLINMNDSQPQRVQGLKIVSTSGHSEIRRTAPGSAATSLPEVAIWRPNFIIAETIVVTIVITVATSISIITIALYDFL